MSGGFRRLEGEHGKRTVKENAISQKML